MIEVGAVPSQDGEAPFRPSEAPTIIMVKV